jgi:hypothetical protein
MWILVKAFIDIALHRRGPEDLPASGFLLGVVVAASVIVETTGCRILGPALGRCALDVGMGLTLFAGFFTLLLVLSGRRPRVPQTLTALFGTAVLLGLLAMPIWVLWPDTFSEEPSLAVQLASLLYLALLLWSFDITAFVMTRAIGVSYAIGVVIALAHFALQMSARSMLLPEA